MPKNNLFIVIATLCYFMSAPCFSLEMPNNYPNEFLYKGQPIDPMCFEGGEKKVALDECGLKSQVEVKISGQDKEFLKKNYYGFNYKQKDNENIQGYSYYKVIGKFKDSWIIFHISSGGGSGVFTSLNLVKRTEDNLLIDKLRGGDRCNGGLNEAKLHNSILSYSVNITPFDYLEIAGQNPHDLKAYDDLAACAACCLGVANFQVDMRHLNKEKLISIDLGKIEEASSNTQGKYQECFNTLLVSYMKQGKHTMKPSDLKSFVNEFNTKCVK